MALDLPKTSRWLSIASMLALAASSALGCTIDRDGAQTATGGETGASVDDITNVAHTKVKRQSIGNCWLYATTSWLEALNQAATGEERNTSESWLTYWHWFEQIANGGSSAEISTGGTYRTAADLIVRYGIVMERDFIASEAEAEMSLRQSLALDAINRSLKEGALKEYAARRDRALVRKELDKAWALDAAVTERIDAVFGASVSKTLDRAYASEAPGHGILRGQDFPAKLKDPQSGEFVTATLADALGQGNGWWAPRIGKLAWNEVDYPSDAESRRAFWQRVQRALHDQQPVITAWKVDFNALAPNSRFSLAELERRGPGRQGGHMTVMHDYQAEVPGVGLLEAGKPATPEQMKAALADDTKIEFVRVKNSWGGIRPDRWSEAAMPGYHDLELAYLDGPIKACSEKPDGSTDLEACTRDVTPLWDVVLPAGY